MCNKLLLKKKENPCQDVSSKLNITSLSNEISNIRQLERILSSRRVLYEKVTIIPKGKSPKMNGSVCNLPIDKDINCNLLPRPEDSNGIFNVKFGFQIEREVTLSPSKLFNQVLLNYSQIFASDSDYIFFAPPNIQKLQLTNSISIALKLETFDSLMLSRKLVCCVEILNILFKTHKVYNFMKRIKNAPVYRKKFFSQSVNNG